MGKLRVFQIQLDDEQLVYSPGDTINGKVLLQLNEDVHLKGLFIKCRGRAKIWWREEKNRYHGNDEQYIRDVLRVDINHESAERLDALRAKVHAFPFQFKIPHDVPSSFEYPKGFVQGHVRYWLKAWLEGVSEEYRLSIYVTAPKDMNRLVVSARDILTPNDLSDFKNVCCLCCRRGPISARMRIERRGFVPGETVQVEAEVEDGTGRGTNGASIKLCMITNCMADDGDIHNDCFTMAKDAREGLPPGGSDSWMGQLQIPPLAASGLQGCSIIDIEYRIVLQVNIRKTPLDLYIEMPVIIGTVPPIQPTPDDDIDQRHQRDGLGKTRPVLDSIRDSDVDFKSIDLMLSKQTQV